MKVEVLSFRNGERVNDKNCFCIPATTDHIDMGENINPTIRWYDYPAETKSFALLCVDPDVPSVGDDVNQEDRFVPTNLPRVDFYHWVLADIPLDINEIKEGDDSNSITLHGKIPGKKPYGITGINDYTGWFAGDTTMEGYYGGYDGPCPPWNDERIHHYHFLVYALDIESTNLSGNFTGKDLLKAIDGHILDHAEHIGTYTLNRNLI